MKHAFLPFISGLLFLMHTHSAQAQYHKLLDNSHFFYNIYDQIGQTFQGSVIVGGDTTINALQYTKMEDTWHQVTYWAREDSAQQKIWTFVDNQPTEVVFYDFSLVVGDQITLQRTASFSATCESSR